MAVHQLLPRFAPGDPASELALLLRQLFRRMGIDGGVFAPEVTRGFAALAGPLHALCAQPQDAVLYHHLGASSASNALLHTRGRRWVLVHQPSLGGAPSAADAELAVLARHVELAAAFDTLTLAQLTARGFRRVVQIQPCVDAERLHAATSAPRERVLIDGEANLPALQAELRRLAPDLEVTSFDSTPGQSITEALYALLPPALQGRADAALDRMPRARKLADTVASRVRGRLTALPATTVAERAAAIASASVYVSLAEQANPLELAQALALRVPVMAFSVPGAEAALGDAGLRFTEKRYALLAELCAELSRPGPLRSKLLEGQERRLEALSPKAQARTWAQLLSPSEARPRRAAKRRRPPRLAVVVQRYGEQVVGGAERLARMVATRLTAGCDVTVLTTRAADHLTWRNALPEGASTEEGVRVLRFPVVQERSMPEFNALSRRTYRGPRGRIEEERWIAAQGPRVPALVRHALEHSADYDAFLFFTYLYAPTVDLLPLVHRRALHLPTAHDEPPLAFEAYRDVFELPRALLCNTPEELELIARRFPRHARARVIGAGVELTRGSAGRFAKAKGLTRPYLLYVGRLEAGKGIPEALRLHQRLRAGFHDAPDFLLAGAGSLALDGEGVRALGPISEQEKQDALAGALAVVIPSRFESLSLLALEAFAAGTPVIANAECDVLRGQVERSQGGLAYTDFESFREGVRLAGVRRQDFGRSGRAYAKRHSWSAVMATYQEEIERVVEENA